MFVEVALEFRVNGTSLHVPTSKFGDILQISTDLSEDECNEVLQDRRLVCVTPFAHLQLLGGFRAELIGLNAEDNMIYTHVYTTDNLPTAAGKVGSLPGRVHGLRPLDALSYKTSTKAANYYQRINKLYIHNTVQNHNVRIDLRTSLHNYAEGLRNVTNRVLGEGILYSESPLILWYVFYWSYVISSEPGLGRSAVCESVQWIPLCKRCPICLSTSARNQSIYRW